MRAVDVIASKRDGHELTPEEIRWFVQSYTSGELPDYQAAAWLMAVYLKGMTRRETVDLTLAMAYSGDVLDLSQVVDYAVDKHSSGGVGDKTTLIVLPLVAAAGVTVAKMSGRGLGFSGGTLDKLESIAGYNVNLTTAQFYEQARRYGIVLCGQSANLAPADGKIYALRDVTATVSSLPLIASSIMSKKIAAGANGIVLDVKTGAGAFMPTVEEARALARLMVDIGRDARRDMVALISDMNQPLGCAVGNALEVREAIETLRGGGPHDLREHCLTVAAHMVRLARRIEGEDALPALKAELAGRLADGAALQKFRTLVMAQGGDVRMVDDPEQLPKARLIKTVPVAAEGYVAQVNALDVAYAALELGAGREKKGDPVDHAVGVIVHLKVGEHVKRGQAAFTIHANDETQLAAAQRRLERAITLSSDPQMPLPLFYDTLYG
ncbi:MAG: thymidine phosphorylase [Anaerolineae bacterium]|nr:thymidine phosphorylase [Anaerolineae bacterium]